MVAVKKLAMYLIPLIVLVISTMGYFGDDGMLGAIGDVGRDIKDAAPNVSAGMEKLKAEHKQMDGEIEVQLASFVAAMQAMLDSDEVDCFGSHLPFKDLGNDTYFEDPKSVRVSLTYDPQTGNTTYAVSDTSQYQFQRQKIETKLCVVAGGRTSYGLPAYNFFRNFIAADNKFNNKRKYKEVTSIKFGFEDDYYNGNRIRTEGQGFTPDENPVNDESDNYESGGLLYKPTEGMICFFPTKYESDYSDDGIEGDFIENENYVDSELRSLSFRLRRDPFDDVKYCDESRNIIPQYVITCPGGSSECPVGCTSNDSNCRQSALEFARNIGDDVDYGDYKEWIDWISPSSSDCSSCGGNDQSIFTTDDWEEISGDGWFDVEEEFDWVTKCLESKSTFSDPTGKSCTFTLMEEVGMFFNELLEDGWQAICENLLGEWICGKPDEPEKD